VKRPFCLEDVKRGALVCRTCSRDIAVPKPLMEANERLAARVAELESELAEAQAAVQSAATHSAPITVEAPPAPPLARFVHALFFYVLLPVLLLVAIHYVLVIRLDARLIWLRAASIILPALFGFRFELAWPRRRAVLFAIAFVVGVSAVLGMSWVVHLVDGDAILPASAAVWRETLEYVASIALAYVMGSLVCAALRPLHSNRRSLVDRLATMIALGEGGVTGKALEARIDRLVKLMKLGMSAATAGAAIYTGLKGTLS